MISLQGFFITGKDLKTTIDIETRLNVSYITNCDYSFKCIILYVGVI